MIKTRQQKRGRPEEVQGRNGPKYNWRTRHCLLCLLCVFLSHSLPWLLQMEVNPTESFLLFSESAKYPGQVDVLWGRKLKERKEWKGGKKGRRERKKHVTLITSMPAGPHSPCFFFPPSSFSVIRPCRRTCTSATGRSVEVTRTQKLREWFHWGEKKKSCVVVIGGGDRRERWRACRSSNCVFFGLFSKCLGALSLRLHLSLSQTLWMEQEAVISG